MKIPNFINEKVVTEDGYFTEPWGHVFNQLFHELQTQMSDESHIAPSQTTDNITNLLNVSDYEGGLVYDTDVNKLKVNINGTFKEVLTT